MDYKIVKHALVFKRPGGTSRGILHKKETYFLFAIQGGEYRGVAECPLFRGLSADDTPNFEEQLKHAFDLWQNQKYDPVAWEDYPSIRFGIEQLERSIAAQHPFEIYPSDFTEGQKKLPINGLIWMGDLDFMQNQIDDKLANGFDCIKLKIGALDFDSEWNLIQKLRSRYHSSDLTIRVDANGAFEVGEALRKLERLAELEIHSIEQPIQAGQWEEMQLLCQKTPLPIALDEELIGIHKPAEKAAVLDQIKPQFIILKPGLLGGFKSSESWIELAQQSNIGWWVTSALESNIGLNAIAQWTATLPAVGHQGLGTGGLFTNNPFGFLEVKNGYLEHHKLGPWTFKV